MTYRARCQGRKGRFGRRWVNLWEGTPRARTSPFWMKVLGTVKLKDIQLNEEGKRLSEAFERGEFDFEVEDE